MILGNNERAVEILLVEDNPAEVRLTLEALKEGGGRHHVSVAEDGEEAVDFLRKNGKHSAAPRPDLILLDLNLPRKDGREVLREIKADAVLRTIPVVVLTNSSADQDIAKAYDLHANCFITKPLDMSQFINVIRTIDRFWFNLVEFPSAYE